MTRTYRVAVIHYVGDGAIEHVGDGAIERLWRSGFLLVISLVGSTKITTALRYNERCSHGIDFEPQDTALICGQCGTRYEFAPSYDRRLPVNAALAAGWITAHTDKGDFDYACPDCLAVDQSPPRTIPDDPPPPRHEPYQVEGATKPQPSPPRSSWRQPTEPIRKRRASRRRRPYSSNEFSFEPFAV